MYAIIAICYWCQGFGSGLIFLPDPDPTSQATLDPGPTAQDKPDPTSQDKSDPDTVVMKIFPLFYEDFY